VPYHHDDLTSPSPLYSDLPRSQGLDSHSIREHNLKPHLKAILLTPSHLFLDLRLLFSCCSVVLGRASHVRPLLGIPANRRSCGLRGPSIAIWNKNKVIMASAAIIWGTNVLFLIRGEHTYTQWDSILIFDTRYQQGE
jgi:hypothetical protein